MRKVCIGVRVVGFFISGKSCVWCDFICESDSEDY